MQKYLPFKGTASSTIRHILRHGKGCPCAFHARTNMPDGLTYQAPKVDNSNFKTQVVAQRTIRPKHRQFSAIPPLDQSQNKLTDYAFEMATSNIRFGFGVTREVGYDCQDLKANLVCVITDPYLAKLKNSPVNTVLNSLTHAKVKFKVFDRVQVEPTDSSFKDAINFAMSQPFDAFVAVGGGSVMDTAKAANLYSTYPADFLDYVNPPIGKGLPPPGPLKPLIAVPTTAGTGSESTGVAIFDLESMNAKTGIANRRLKPTLGIVDPENTRTLPPEIAAASGFDVLCHALESYTAIPFNKRAPRPEKPIQRPAYQGSNPISDQWSLKSLEMIAKYLPIAVENPENDEARAQCILASSFAGVGFGNAGVHLCHGMSYPVSGNVRSFKPSGYPTDHPMIPHGMSVVLHAPAVFKFTGMTDPERHLTCAKLMGADISNVQPQDAGAVLAERVRAIMKRLKVPNGLKAVGFTESDIPKLVEGTLPQHRVTKLSPRPVGVAELELLFKDSMEVY